MEEHLLFQIRDGSPNSSSSVFIRDLSVSFEPADSFASAAHVGGVLGVVSTSKRYPAAPLDDGVRFSFSLKQQSLRLLRLVVVCSMTGWVSLLRLKTCCECGAFNDETLLRLSNLVSLNLNQNDLTGTLPSLFPTSWPNLLQLMLGFNHLSGTITDDLDSLSLLQALELADNNFTGPFPTALASMNQLQVINLNNNDLTGTLPGNWTSLSQTLHTFGAEGNRLTGTIPESLGDLKVLKRLSLADNALNGTLPALLGNATLLEYVSLNYNNFSGTVPRSFMQWESLGEFLP